MIRRFASRRLLLGLAALLALALVAATDGFVIEHFGAHAAADRGTDSYFNAIACPSATQCWAVGQTATALGGNTYSEVRSQLIEQETGGAWHKVPAPDHQLRDLALTGIACPGAKDCWAVGGSSTAGPAVIEHWTGGAWQLVRSPALRGGQLVSVNCASASLCWAYGGRLTRKNRSSDVLEQWDGSRWQMLPGLPFGLHPTLFACPAAGHCLILGLRGYAVAAASYDLGHWTQVAPPGGVPGVRLPSLLACASTTSCLVLLAAHDRPAVLQVWNGRSWTSGGASPVPYPAGLACSGSHGCFLIGASRSLRPLALRWQGGSWARAATGGSPLGYLGGLACASSCWAVGGRTTTLGDGSSYSRPLIAAVAG
jgi:hypothetical protein